MPGLNNCFLDALDPVDVARWNTQMELEQLDYGELLVRSGQRVADVYFPLDARVALIADNTDGTQTLLTAIGNEGCTGLATVLGGITRASAVVQNEGTAWRMPARFFLSEYRTSPTVFNVVNGYLQFLIGELVQATTCRQNHSLLQQVCRWTLEFDDGREIKATHQLAAVRLGARRETITEIFRKLSSEGVIAPGRGRFRVIDREALHKYSCDCYDLKQDGVVLLYGLAPHCGAVTSATRSLHQAGAEAGRAQAARRPRT